VITRRVADFFVSAVKIFSVRGILALVFCALWCIPPARGQLGAQGTLTVTVQDLSDAVIRGAQLSLVNQATNSVRTIDTQAAGRATFVGLPPGTYTLTVTKTGFEKQVFSMVVVHAEQTTDLRASLAIGAVNTEVHVSESAVPLLTTTSNAIGTTIDLTQVNNLPLAGRDVTQLADVVPGYTGTWNGLPTAAQSNTINGAISNTSRNKYSGNSEPAVSPRLEAIQEMTVQTDQLDLAQGNGQADMVISFVSKRGGNAFHGSMYEDFRNSALNANTWFNNAAKLKRNHLILNDFGGTFGGPIIHDKLFFFGSFAASIQPGGSTVSRKILTPAAQAGNVTYTDTRGHVNTVNVLTQIAAPNGLPSTINDTSATMLQSVAGVTQYGAVTPTSDPNVDQVSWSNPSPQTYYYPSIRLDYNISPKLMLDFNFLETKLSHTGTTAPPFPGPAFSDLSASTKNTDYTTGLGLTWIPTSMMTNEFRAGYLYTAAFNTEGAAPLYRTQEAISWGLGYSPDTTYPAPASTLRSVLDAADTVSWQKRAHLLQFGMDWWREQDHNWGSPSDQPSISLALNKLDPASSIFANSSYFAGQPAKGLGDAESLYALLVGRISSAGYTSQFNPATKQYFTQGEIGTSHLDERQQAAGLFFQDSYRIKPSLTLNYGMRWDFTGEDHDLTGQYTSATLANVYGPTAPGDIFKPGVLNGIANPVMTAENKFPGWKLQPQPAFGFVWNPNVQEGILGKLFGGRSTALRGGYSLRSYTVPAQFFWDAAGDFAANITSTATLTAATGGAPGTFSPGSLVLGDSLPPLRLSPATFQATLPEAELTFVGAKGVGGLDPSAIQPYVESWNFGIQRALGSNDVIEVRYIGNRSLHEWVQVNPNEVNIFENGFLKEFQAAQANMTINAANGIANSFANNGYAGQHALPIMTAAHVSPTNGGFLDDLETGAAGAFATTLAYTPNYLCPLVGSAAFSPCAPYVGTGVAGAYPVNFFQANPYAAGHYYGYSSSYMTDAGYSNYNGLQVDFRQKEWRGMEFDANYTWSHSLGLDTGTAYVGGLNMVTMRNLRLGYAPTMFNLPNVLHAYGTYALPFGHGQSRLNGRGLAPKLIGDWVVGTIVTYESGAPFQLYGGNETYNDTADGGVILSGVSRAQLQSAVGVSEMRGKTYAYGINSKFIGSDGTANPTYLTPNATAGTIVTAPWLHGPRQFYQDLSLTKAFFVRNEINMKLQGEFLNVFNHPVWGSPNASLLSTGFGESSVSNTSRQIELRLNVAF